MLPNTTVTVSRGGIVRGASWTNRAVQIDGPKSKSVFGQAGSTLAATLRDLISADYKTGDILTITGFIPAQAGVTPEVATWEVMSTRTLGGLLPRMECDLEARYQ